MTIELDEIQTVVWESDGPAGELLRARVRGEDRAPGHYEVRSWDGVTLDAWEVENV